MPEDVRGLYIQRQAEIEWAIDHGATADEVTEAIISRPGLSEDDRAALELWAWAWEQTRPPSWKNRRHAAVLAGAM